MIRDYKLPINRPAWIFHDFVSAPAFWCLAWAITVRFFSYDIYVWLSQQPWGTEVAKGDWVPQMFRVSAAQFYALHYQGLLAFAAVALCFILSFNPSVPGPGRQIFIVWRRRRVNKIISTKGSRELAKRENPVFPPLFNPLLDVNVKAVEEQKKNPNGIILGFKKPFKQDLDFRRRHGDKVPDYSEYFPLVLSNKVRERHVLISGGSGSGKSASIIAPTIDYDTSHPVTATVCFNPKGDDYLLRVAARRIMERRSDAEHGDLLVEYQDYLTKGGNQPFHVWALHEKKVRVKPFALITIAHPEISLGYDPLQHGDADEVTKKIIYSADNIGGSAFYMAEQQTWLQDIMNVILTDPDLKGRIGMEHIHWFATAPGQRLPKALAPLLSVDPEIKFPYLAEKIKRTKAYQEALDAGKEDVANSLKDQGILSREEEDLIRGHEDNRVRLENLRRKDPENLSGLAAHISMLVGDQSIKSIFNDSSIPSLNIREVIEAGGIVYVEVPTQAKSPQARAIARMLMMELQILSADRDRGAEPKDVPVSVIIDEFGSLVYNEFINFIDKARSSKFRISLAHQSLGNLSKAHLHSSFMDEILDNTATKIILQLGHVGTQEYFAKVIGDVENLRRSVSESAGTSSGGGGGSMFSARKNKGLSRQHAEVREQVVSASDMACMKGFGFARILEENEESERYAISVNYIKERDLPSLGEVMAFVQQERKMFRARPLPYYKISPIDGRLYDPFLEKFVFAGSHVAVSNKLGEAHPNTKLGTPPAPPAEDQAGASAPAVPGPAAPPPAPASAPEAPAPDAEDVPSPPPFSPSLADEFGEEEFIPPPEEEPYSGPVEVGEASLDDLFGPSPTDLDLQGAPRMDEQPHQVAEAGDAFDALADSAPVPSGTAQADESRAHDAVSGTTPESSNPPPPKKKLPKKG